MKKSDSSEKTKPAAKKPAATKKPVKTAAKAPAKAKTASVKVKTKAEMRPINETPIMPHLGSRRVKPEETKLPKVDLETPPWEAAEATSTVVPEPTQVQPQSKGITMADVKARQSQAVQSPLTLPKPAPTGRPLTMNDIYNSRR